MSSVHTFLDNFFKFHFNIFLTSTLYAFEFESSFQVFWHNSAYICPFLRVSYKPCRCRSISFDRPNNILRIVQIMKLPKQIPTYEII